MRRMLMAAGLILLPGTVQGQLSAGPDELARLGWMAGCWAAESPGLTIQEQRMPLAGGTMVGMGRTLRGDRTVDAELTIVRLRGDSLVYEAFPQGQAPAVFTAVALTDSSVVFADPAHDFPQRILYWRVGADSLRARIEGDRNGQVRGVDFPMARQPCEQ